MLKKIIVEPTFCEAHFLDAHIRNMCDYVKPDIFVLAEGMFPKGPENNTEYVEDFKRKWTLNGEGRRGFDFEKVVGVIEKNKQAYPNTIFHLIPMMYDQDIDTAQAYYEAYTSFRQVYTPKPTDIIFPSESDLFFTELQAAQILEYINHLAVDQGFGSTLRLFFESPTVSIPGYGGQGRKRKVALRYGSGQLMDMIAHGNFKESYHPYLKWYDLGLFHYEWIRPAEYWDLRFDQLRRRTITYKAFQQAKLLIEENGPNLKKDLEALHGWDGSFTLTLNDLRIEDHPVHIRSHPQFIKYFGEVDEKDHS